MTDDRIHDLEPGVGGGTGATTNPGPGHLPHDGRSAAELAPESAAEGYGPAVTPAASGDGAIAPASVDPDAAAAAPAVGEDADAPGSDDERTAASEDARTPGVDEVPGPHGVDDPDQNPPLPDWGPTDGTHGEG